MMKKFLSLLLCLTMTLALFPGRAYADVVWPENVSIEAEGGIVMDADTGTVLYGKNIHVAYYPASITKVLTALIVIEQCSLDEMVTFSHNAVYNVEAGSSSAGLDEGDVLSVKDCLYALLLKSANESANALAEHVAGSTEKFAEMMNQKAAFLGCQDSHFANPSGLNDPEHYVSAYDMALIGQAALQNETFMEIDSTLYYDLPVTKRNPEGGRIYPGHKMLKKNMAEYYDGCIGGKTGYTSLAGNTLITFARRDGMTLVSVVLNGHQTQYPDTKALLDFGFKNFQTVSAAEYDTTYPSVENDMTISGLTTTQLSSLEIDPEYKVTIPKSADFSAVSSQIFYELTDKDPPDAIARIDYQWGQRKIGTSYLKLNTINRTPISDGTAALNPNGEPASLADGTVGGAADGVAGDTTGGPANGVADGVTDGAANGTTGGAADGTTTTKDSRKPSPLSTFHVPTIVWISLGVIAAIALLVGLFLLIKMHLEKKEEEARMLRRQKRLARLEEGGISPAEFDLMMEKRRSSYTTKRSSRKKKRRGSSDSRFHS